MIAYTDYSLTTTVLAKVPSHTEGFMGDAVNMLLTPPYILDQVEVVKNPNEYLAAIRDGKVWDNCSAYTSKCGRSFFKVRKIASLDPLTAHVPYLVLDARPFR